MDLKDFFADNPKVALAFSGGVDSSFLLYAGLHHGADLRPYYVKTAFQPEFEQKDALRMGDKLGRSITILPCDILSCPNIPANPENRCYFCKSAIFDLLRQRAREDGYSLLIDGTNASDQSSDRPGMKALEERNVRSPLRECGLTKEQIRTLSREAGLFTWDKPAYACLATRIPAGTPITGELLSKIESAEDALFRLGFSDFRVRFFHGAARLQFLEGQMPLAFESRKQIADALRPLFPVILMDMEAR